MVKPINKTYTLLAPVNNYFANNVTGASWTITTQAISNGQAYKVAILNNSGTDHSAKTVTITGLNQDGISQSETFNLPASHLTVYSTYYYSALYTAVPSASIGADTMNIGFTSQFCTPTIPLDYGSIGGSISVDFVSGTTINYTVQATSDNIQKKTPPFFWQNVGTPLTGATVVENAYVPQATRALNLITASYSSTPTLQLSILQAQNRE
jgi:hypothetical protein